jgi:uncharacterized coiled-coil protein SlyX
MNLDLAGIAALIATGIVVWKAFFETRATSADTASKYEELANRSAERALSLDSRVSDLEKRIDEQQQTIESLRCENADLRDWAERLVHQVQSLGGAPVEIRERAML